MRKDTLKSAVTTAVVLWASRRRELSFSNQPISQRTYSVLTDQKVIADLFPFATSYARQTSDSSQVYRSSARGSPGHFDFHYFLFPKNHGPVVRSRHQSLKMENFSQKSDEPHFIPPSLPKFETPARLLPHLFRRWFCRKLAYRCQTDQHHTS